MACQQCSAYAQVSAAVPVSVIHSTLSSAVLHLYPTKTNTEDYPKWQGLPSLSAWSSSSSQSTILQALMENQITRLSNARFTAACLRPVSQRPATKAQVKTCHMSLPIAAGESSTTRACS